MNANRANQLWVSARTGAALISSAAIAVAIGVLGVTDHDDGQNQTAIAHPSGGHTVTIEPHVVPPTVTVTSRRHRLQYRTRHQRCGHLSPELYDIQSSSADRKKSKTACTPVASIGVTGRSCC